jgi:hypothetical protein
LNGSGRPEAVFADPTRYGSARNASAITSRLLKTSFATGLQDLIIAVVEGQLDLDGAVVFEFGRA